MSIIQEIELLREQISKLQEELRILEECEDEDDGGDKA